MKKDRFNMRNGLMIIRRGIFLSIILSSLFACASVRIKQSAVKPDEIMNFVDKNYDNFLITYSSENGLPTAIRFDLKNDDVALTGDGWHPVESKAQLHDIFDSLIADYRRYEEVGPRGPYLFEIQSKEGKVIGYFYCLLVRLNIRQEGNNYWMAPVTYADLIDEKKIYSIKSVGGLQ